jgi:DNA-binding protein Fis
LKKADGNQSQAARMLGINRVTVWNRMKKYGIDLKRVMTT